MASSCGNASAPEAPEFVYPLKIGLNTMGRSADNDIIVEDLYVSRRHCAVLMHHDNNCVLQDPASKSPVLKRQRTEPTGDRHDRELPRESRAVPH